MPKWLGLCFKSDLTKASGDGSGFKIFSVPTAKGVCKPTKVPYTKNGGSILR